MRKPLTKSQFIAAMAEKTNMSKKEMNEWWDMFVAFVHDEVRQAGAMTLPDLGKLMKQERSERMGRNPATGEQIKIPAKTVVKFRVAKATKEAVL